MDSQIKKKKILQVSNYFPPELGGIEKIAQAISKAIEGQYEEKVICFTHDKQDRTEYIGNSEIIRCGTKMMIDSQQLSFSMSKKMGQLMADFAPDIVIIHLPNPFTSYLVKKYIKSETKLIVYWHSDIVKQRIGEKIFRKMVFGLLERADKIVVTSPNYIDDSIYLSKYKDKCIVVPNCIEEDKLEIDEETRKLADKIRDENADKIICVGVGRQVSYKGFEYLVQAMKELDERFELFLIGRKGEATNNIVKISQNLKNVHLIGEADHKTLKAHLAACDIFCFPSITKNEAFGIALAEGMYFNKPAITFTIKGSGVNYVNVDKLTGIEVENGNVREYAQAMKELANNTSLREEYGQQAGKRVRELFLSKSFEKHILEILNQM